MLNYDDSINQSKSSPNEVEQLELKDTNFNVAFGMRTVRPYKSLQEDDLKGYMTLRAEVVNWNFETDTLGKRQPLSFHQCNEDDLKEFDSPEMKIDMDVDSWLTNLNCFDDLKLQTLQGYGSSEVSLTNKGSILEIYAQKCIGLGCKSEDEIEAFVKNLKLHIQYNSQEFHNWVYDDNGGVYKRRHLASYPIQN